MFQQVVSQLIRPADVGVLLSAPAALTGQALFESICARLDRDLPLGPYLADEEFAKLLGITVKTLSNLRSAKPLRYPKPLKMGGCRQGKHVRSEIIAWLAREEFSARAQTVHRCL